MIFDVLGGILDSQGSRSQGTTAGSTRLGAQRQDQPGSPSKLGARNGTLELEMEPWNSKWSPGPRNGALELLATRTARNTIEFDVLGAFLEPPGKWTWIPFLKEFIDFH